MDWNDLEPLVSILVDVAALAAVHYGVIDIPTATAMIGSSKGMLGIRETRKQMQRRSSSTDPETSTAVGEQPSSSRTGYVPDEDPSSDREPDPSIVSSGIHNPSEHSNKTEDET